MTGSVSAKTVSTIEARPQPREGKQSRADVFRATLDRIPTADAGSTGRTGPISATTALSDGYSRPMAGLEQQVIRLSVASGAAREEAVTPDTSPDRNRAGGAKEPSPGSVPRIEMLKAKNGPEADLRATVASDEFAAEIAPGRNDAEASAIGEAGDDNAKQTNNVAETEAPARDAGPPVDPLVAALLMPARESVRTAARREGDEAGAAGTPVEDHEEQPPRLDKESRAGNNLASEEPPTATAGALGTSDIPRSTVPKNEAGSKQADMPTRDPSASPREVTDQPVRASRAEARGDASVSGNTPGSAVDAPEGAASTLQASPSARDVAAVAKAAAVSVSMTGPDDAQPMRTVRQDESRPGQAAQLSVPVSDASLQTGEFVASAKQAPVGTTLAYNGQTVAQAATMSSSVMPGRAEPAKPSRIAPSDTKPQTAGALSAPTSSVSTAVETSMAQGPRSVSAGENAEADTLQADLAPSDEPVERAPAEGGSRDIVRGLNASNAPAAAPAPVSANPATLTTPAAAVLEAIRSEAAWTAHLGNTRPGVPGEVKSLKISLTPVELGHVVAHLTVEDESVSVELTAETSEAQSRLSADTDAIVKSLRAIGLEVDRITVQLAPRADAPTQADTGAGARQQGFATDSGAGDARGQSSGSQTDRSASATEETAVRTDTSATPNRNTSSRYI